MRTQVPNESTNHYRQASRNLEGECGGSKEITAEDTGKERRGEKKKKKLNTQMALLDMAIGRYGTIGGLGCDGWEE